ncbi:hsp20/alpha crystallin family domain-containing protein [Ditylenchus destructor]|uniref:Hsp20/alpha crystallin family domain-containing protein n=1 Tax=Ditylenchus destructor TaxID=166010 RepID=A0AAD4MPN1_9BILA|nr:hsp20/alpha crystallin family domain-containing protein [Ditylenchus destructor]
MAGMEWMPYVWRDPFVHQQRHPLPHLTFSNPFHSHHGNRYRPLLDHFHHHDLQQGIVQLKMRDHAAMLTFDEEGNFTYKVDVQGYRKEELVVDVVGDDVKVKGEHKSKTEDETVERSFSRTVRIPKGIHKDTIECRIDNKGHFLVVQGWKTPIEQLEKRNIPITVAKSEE